MNRTCLHLPAASGLLLAVMCCGWVASNAPLRAAELWIGAATTSITPDKEDLALPVRKVTAKEAAEARAQIDALAKKGDTSRRVVQSNMVGPEGGQILVNRTLELIDAMWAKSR